MARNQYPGICYCCEEFVPIGFGHFERHRGSWRIKCVKCASGRTVQETDPEVTRAKKMAAMDEKDTHRQTTKMEDT